MVRKRKHWLTCKWGLIDTLPVPSLKQAEGHSSGFILRDDIHKMSYISASNLFIYQLYICIRSLWYFTEAEDDFGMVAWTAFMRPSWCFWLFKAWSSSLFTFYGKESSLFVFHQKKKESNAGLERGRVNDDRSYLQQNQSVHTKPLYLIASKEGTINIRSFIWAYDFKVCPADV